MDWRKEDDVLRQMRRRVSKQLRVAGHAPAEAKRLATEIIGLAKARHVLA